MATRQPARDVGTLFDFRSFCKIVRKQFVTTNKISRKIELNKACAEEQNKKAYQILQLFERKKADCEKLAGDD